MLIANRKRVSVAVADQLARRGEPEVVQQLLRNKGAVFSMKRAMENTPNLKVTIPNAVEEALLEKLKLS